MYGGELWVQRVKGLGTRVCVCIEVQWCSERTNTLPFAIGISPSSVHTTRTGLLPWYVVACGCLA